MSRCAAPPSLRYVQTPEQAVHNELSDGKSLRHHRVRVFSRQMACRELHGQANRQTEFLADNSTSGQESYQAPVPERESRLAVRVHPLDA